MSILENYRDQMVNSLLLYYGEDKRDIITELVEDKINEEVGGETVEFVNNYRRTATSMPMLEVFDNLLTKKHHSIGVNGAIYDNRESPLAPKMLLSLKDMRKKNKGQMFGFLNERDKHPDKESPEYKELQGKADAKNIAQLDNKLMMNSYYGILGEANSIFFNKFNVEAVTWTGRATITTALVTFETFLGNILFDNFTELSKYLLEIVNDFDEVGEDYFIDSDEVDITMEMLTERFISNTKNISNREIELLEGFLDRYKDDEFMKYLLYYRNNFYEFIKLDSIKSALEELVVGDDFIDVDKTIANMDKDDASEPEALLATVWEYLENIVSHYHFYYNRFRRSLEENRDHVLTVDTDSNYVNLDPFYQFCKANFKLKETVHNRVSVVNILTVFLTVLLVKNFKMMTDKLNIPDHLAGFIAMKNELLIDRIILTSRKKWYAYTAIAQEGNIFASPELTMKGISIKKSGIHKNIRAYFKDLLEVEFFAEKIDILSILKKLANFKILIHDELGKGSIEYSKTETVNPKTNYVYPYRIGVFRGAVVWNKLYPNKKISFGDKCMTYKCTTRKLDDIAGLEKSNPREYKILKETVFSNENFANFGMSVISIPFSEDNIPKWLIQFIDRDTIVEDNLKHIYPLLESTGLSIVTVRGTEHYTNITDNTLEI